MANYRIEKDGRSKYISPELVEFYANNGWRIFKPLEQEITNQEHEIQLALETTSVTPAERIEINHVD